MSAIITFGLIVILAGFGPQLGRAGEVRCRGIERNICSKINGQLLFSDGCQTCRCVYKRARCPNKECRTEQSEDKEECDRVRDIFRQKITPRPPCLTPKIVCPERPEAVFYQSCNRCQCEGETARCNKAYCPEVTNFTDDQYDQYCMRQKMRVLGVVSDRYRFIKRAIYI